jgi:hypothetical protein
MEHKSSWEADSRLAGENIVILIWSQKGVYHVQKTPPLVSILSQSNSVQTLIQNFFSDEF